MTKPGIAMNSPLLVWTLAALGFVLASWCLVVLTWDGSYYLLTTLQTGIPIAPHNRHFNHFLLQPVLWAAAWLPTPEGIAFFHGLMCSLLPLLSLGACLAMLRGKLAPLRIWPVVGILLAPLPGQIVLVGEVTPTLQLAWVAFVFIWCRCPWVWSPVVLFSLAAMGTLHPAASPLFLVAGLIAACFAWMESGIARRRLMLWAGVFVLAAVAKLTEVLLVASDYERGNFSVSVWQGELVTGLFLTPALILAPVLADLILRLWFALKGRTCNRNLSRALWLSAFILGLYFAVSAMSWNSAINYRKFGIFVVVPLALLGSLDYWRIQRGERLSTASGAGPNLVAPVLLFVVVFGGMSLTWKSLCGELVRHLASRDERIVTYDSLPPRFHHTALNHWSTTSLSLLIQNWEPSKIIIWEPKSQMTGADIQICPPAPFAWNDHRFQLEWVKSLPEKRAAFGEDEVPSI